MRVKAAGRVHWSFWVIGASGLVFHLAGGVNFFSQMNANIVDAMPEAYRIIEEGLDQLRPISDERLLLVKAAIQRTNRRTTAHDP